MTFARVTSCMDAIDRWMASNRLKLNADKTQFIILGSRLQLSKVKCDSICLGGLDIPFLQKITFLGVILDTELSMVQQVHGATSRFFLPTETDSRYSQISDHRDIKVTCAYFYKQKIGLLQQRSVRCWSGASPKTTVRSK